MVNAPRRHLGIGRDLDPPGERADPGVVEGGGLEGGEVRPAEHERRRHRPGNRELRREPIRRRGIGHAEAERDRAHLDLRHLVPGETMVARERHHCVEGEVVEAAAGVELEVILLDAVSPAEPLDREGAVKALGQDRAVHVGGRVGEPGEAGALQVDGQDALEGGAPGVEVADRRPFERRRPRVRGAHRRREVHYLPHRRRRSALERGDGSRRADRPPRAVRVYVGTDGGGAAEARADLVARDQRLEQPAPAEPSLFRHREGARHHMDGGMTAAQAVPLVYLERYPRRRVGQRRPVGVGLLAVAQQRGLAVRRARGGESGETSVLVERAPCHDRPERVEQHVLPGGDRARRERLQPRRLHEASEAVQVAHQRTPPAMGACGPPRGR